MYESNETAKVLWELNVAIGNKIGVLQREQDNLYHKFAFDEIKKLSSIIEAYEDCQTEIMKIFPKYAFPDK